MCISVVLFFFGLVLSDFFDDPTAQQCLFFQITPTLIGGITSLKVIIFFEDGSKQETTVLLDDFINVQVGKKVKRFIVMKSDSGGGMLIIRLGVCSETVAPTTTTAGENIVGSCVLCPMKPCVYLT